MTNTGMPILPLNSAMYHPMVPQSNLQGLMPLQYVPYPRTHINNMGIPQPQYLPYVATETQDIFNATVRRWPMHYDAPRLPRYSPGFPNGTFVDECTPFPSQLVPMGPAAYPYPPLAHQVVPPAPNPAHYINPHSNQNTPDPHSIQNTPDPQSNQNTHDPYSNQNTHDPHSNQNTHDPHSNQNTHDPHSNQNTHDPHSNQNTHDPQSDQNIFDPRLNPNTPEFHTKSSITAQIALALTDINDGVINVTSSGDSGIGSPGSSPFDFDDLKKALKHRLLSYEEIKIETHPFWTVAQDNKYLNSIRRLPPPPEQCLAIVEQIELYMSDDYLAGDKYLLHQIKSKKEGYVSIKHMKSFKRMKKIARDWVVLRSAIVRGSKHLVISEEGSRLRRKEPLPELLRQPRKISILLAIRLPTDFSAVDKVTSLFREFGELVSVRLLKPDKPVPVDIRNYATQIPDLGATLCAVVQYECADNALSAVRLLKYRTRHCKPEDDTTDAEDKNKLKKDGDRSDEDNLLLNKITEKFPDLGEMRLALLGPRVRRTLYRQDRKKQDDAAGHSESHNPDDEGTDTETLTPSPEILARGQCIDTSPISANQSSTSPSVNQRNDASLMRGPKQMVKNNVREPVGPTEECMGFGYERAKRHA